MTGSEINRQDRNIPPDLSSKNQGSTSHINMVNGSGSPSWSAAASAVTYKEMSLTLQHVGDVEPKPLTKREVIHLLVQKLKIPPEHLIAIDNSYYKSIKVRVNPTLNVEDYLNVNALVLKPGLRLEPSKRLDKEVWVRIYRCSLYDSDAEMTKVLEEFGIVTSPMECMTYGASEDELMDKVKHVKEPNRRIRMKLFKSVPSFIMLGSKRLETKHPGQIRWCARCCHPRDSCPGQGKAKACEEEGGMKRKLIDVWDQVKELAPVLNVTHEIDCDYLELSGFHQTDEVDDVAGWIKEHSQVEVIKDTLIKRPTIGVWRLLAPEDKEITTKIVKDCSMKKRSGKYVSILPYTGDPREDESETKKDEEEEATLQMKAGDEKKKDDDKDDNAGGSGGNSGTSSPPSGQHDGPSNQDQGQDDKPAPAGPQGPPSGSLSSNDKDDHDSSESSSDIFSPNKNPTYAQKLIESLDSIISSKKPTHFCSPTPSSSVETQVSSHAIEEEQRRVQKDTAAEIMNLLASPEPMDLTALDLSMKKGPTTVEETPEVSKPIATVAPIVSPKKSGSGSDESVVCDTPAGVPSQPFEFHFKPVLTSTSQGEPSKVSRTNARKIRSFYERASPAQTRLAKKLKSQAKRKAVRQTPSPIAGRTIANVEQFAQVNNKKRSKKSPLATLDEEVAKTPPKSKNKLDFDFLASDDDDFKEDSPNLLCELAAFNRIHAKAATQAKVDKAKAGSSKKKVVSKKKN